MGKQIASLYAEIGADTTKLEAGLKRTKTGLQDTAAQSKNVGANVAAGFAKAAIAIGGVSAALSVAKGAFDAVLDLGKQGSALEYAASKFDRLAVSAGTTSDILLKDLKRATSGMVSDAGLMASAGDLMALGLAKSRDEVVRLTSVAGALGMDMNQLVLTLTNQTTMRFDQLGVSVDGFDEKVKKLKDSGMEAGAAFKEAFLQQAEAQVEKIGSKADTSAGKIARMEAATKNMGDAFKLWAAPAIADVAGQLGEMLTAADLVRERMNKFETGSSDSGRQRRERERLLAIYEASKAGQAYADRYQAQADAIESASKRSSAAVAESADEMRSEYRWLADEMERDRKKIADALSFEREADNFKSAIDGKFGSAQRDFTEKQDELKTQLVETNAELDRLQTKEPWNKKGIQDAIDKQRELTGEIAATGEEYNKTVQRMAFDELVKEAERTGGVLTDQERGVLTEMGKALGVYDQTTYDVMQAVQKSADELENTPWPYLVDDILKAAGLDAPIAVKIQMQPTIEMLSSTPEGFDPKKGGPAADLAESLTRTLEDNIATTMQNTAGAFDAGVRATEGMSAALAANQGAWDAYGTKMDGAKTKTEDAMASFLNFIRHIGEADGMTVTINVNTVTSYSGNGGGSGDRTGERHGGLQEALGGPVEANAPYWVGERGPEPFFPEVNGRVLSRQEAMDALSGSVGGKPSTVNINVENLRNPVDIEVLAHRVAQKLTGRG